MSTNLEKLKSIFKTVEDLSFDPEDVLFGSTCPYLFRYKSLEEVLKGIDPVSHEAFTEAYNCFTTAKVMDEYGQDDEYSGPVGCVIKFPYLDNMCVDFYGHYKSHWGTDYEGMREVFPKEVIKTEWSTKP